MSFPEGRKDWSLILSILIELLRLIIDAFGDDKHNASR